MVEYFLKASLERNTVINIFYLKDNQITERNIKVFDINNGKVKAFCFLRNQNRVFKVENILSASYLQNKYKLAK